MKVAPPVAVNYSTTSRLRSNTCQNERDSDDMSLGEQRVAGEIEYGVGDHRLPMGSELLTVAEVSNMLRVSKMTIYRMVHSGELTHVRVGRSFRIPADAVRSILGSRISGDHFHV